MRFLLFILLVFSPIFVFAETKTITKEADVIVPTNQSIEQVIQYTSDKLFREAAEEAGVAISSSTVLVDGKVSKDEIKMQTSSIAKKDVKHLDTYTKNGQTYIKLQVKATVDSDKLDTFLRQLMQNASLQKELEKERKEKLELEKQLKNATKEEYDKKLSKQAMDIAKTQEIRQKQLETEVSNAKQALLETQRRQQAEELKAAKELEQIEKEYLAKETLLQAKIVAEKDSQAKAEMEYQALLAELAKNAIVNDKIFDITASDTIEMVVADATKVRTNFSSIVQEYNTKLNATKKQLDMYHKSQLAILEKQTFLEQAPEKEEWDNTATYNEKLSAYKKRKADFDKKKQQDINELKSNYATRIANIEKETKTSLLSALNPLYERLQKYNTGNYVSSNLSKAVIDFGERDLDKLTLPIIIKYKSSKYKFKYNFTSLQEFRTMYDTRTSFKAIPVFAVEPNGIKGSKQYLKGFRVVHLGNNKEKFFPTNKKHSPFPEILQYETMFEELHPKPDYNDYEDTYVATTQKEENAYSYNIKQHTSDTTRPINNYKTSYWLYGFQTGIGFDLDIINLEFAVQTHWRFNRWLGIYFNGSILVGISGLQGNSDYDDDDYYYYHYYYDDDDYNHIDTGLAFGLGLDIYLTNNALLFGEVNLAYFIEDNGHSGFGGLFRGGLAFQNSNMRRGMRLNLFIEGIMSNTISSQTPYFGLGLHF